MHHVFVDFPTMAYGLNADEERLLKARPVFVQVSAPDMLGGEFATLPNGEEVLMSCRIRDDYMRRNPKVDSRWSQERIERVRVYFSPRPSGVKKEELLVFSRFREQELTYDDFLVLGGVGGATETWERADPDKDFVLVSRLPFRYPGIPLFTFYTNYAGRLRAKPYFWKLAQLNIEHWQFSSVHKSYTDMIQVGGWVRKGVGQGAVEPIEFGHKRVIDLPSEQELLPLEHQGHAYEAGKDYKGSLEHRMRYLSLSPFVEDNPSDVTATGDVIRDAKSNATIHRWIRAEEIFARNLYGAAATWLNVNRPTAATAPVLLPDDFAVDIYSDFQAGVFSAQENQALYQDWQAGVISDETYLQERKRRGAYPDFFDPEEEARKAKAGRLAAIPNVRSEIPDEEEEEAAA
jgi:hypothetical protein